MYKIDQDSKSRTFPRSDLEIPSRDVTTKLQVHHKSVLKREFPLLMEEILHRLGLKKPSKQWDAYQLVQIFFYQQYVPKSWLLPSPKVCELSNANSQVQSHKSDLVCIINKYIYKWRSKRLSCIKHKGLLANAIVMTCLCSHTHPMIDAACREILDDDKTIFDSRLYIELLWGIGEFNQPFIFFFELLVGHDALCQVCNSRSELLTCNKANACATEPC